MSGMDRVEFYINDARVCTDLTAPYEWVMYAWPSGLDYTIKATAFDKAGNSAYETVNLSDIESYPSSQSSSSQQSSTGTTVVKKITIPASYDGNTLYVGGSGPNNYSSIQAAINAANPGDTVFVFNGTYYECLIVQKTISLIGQDKYTTIIDGNAIPDRVGVVFLQYGGGVLVTGFTIQNGGYEAVVNIWSNNNIITGNIISGKIGNNDGFRIYGNYNTISGNIIRDNKKYGINLYDSNHNTIINNTFESGDGIYITCMWEDPYESWGTHHITDNTANGKPIYYYKNENGVAVPSDASQVILANCHNCIVQDLSISDMEVGILVGGYSYGNHIHDNSITDAGCGIELEYEASYNNISENIIINSGRGIFLCDTEGNTIYGNTIEENNIGIYATPSQLPLSRGNRYPTLLSDNDICRNTIKNNNMGIYISHGWNNNVFENNITNNGYGIYMEGSYGWGGNNNIYRNNIMNNKNGIYITCLMAGMSNNKIYHNNFIGNSDHANDFTDNNKWDNGSVGNYWDDYEGIDEDEDGIGDTPYHINSLDKDRFPLMTALGIESDPPNTPDKPSGKSSGIIPFLKYTYTTSTTDPNGDKIRYLFDWGDGTMTWTDYYNSGETAKASHRWTGSGTFEIKVKAKDIYGYESEWSDSLSVSMPVNQPSSQPSSQQSTPLFFQILQRLMNTR